MIYLDNAATTKVSEEVITDIVESLRNDWANPSSPYEEGVAVRRKIDRARKQIADYINAEPEEIIFTGSGSEANNLAIKGFMDANKLFDCIVSDELEHPSVYNTCMYYKDKKHYDVAFCSAQDGVVSLKRFHSIMSLMSHSHFCLASVMMANNETGVVNPIKKLAKETHRHQGVFHTDATQAFGKIPIDVKDLDVDMMSVGLHKIGLPKGIGFLYKKNGIKLDPIVHGGHQEMNYRAGTENVSYIIAAGNQVERVSKKEFPDSFVKDYLLSKMQAACDLIGVDVRYNERIGNEYLPTIVSVVFKGINSEVLITLLNERCVCVSAGSACSSGEKTPSRVLKAIGLSDDDAFSTVRISIGEDITEKECDEFAKILKECLNILRLVG